MSFRIGEKVILKHTRAKLNVGLDCDSKGVKGYRPEDIGKIFTIVKKYDYWDFEVFCENSSIRALMKDQIEKLPILDTDLWKVLS